MDPAMSRLEVVERSTPYGAERVFGTLDDVDF